MAIFELLDYIVNEVSEAVLTAKETFVPGTEWMCECDVNHDFIFSLLRSCQGSSVLTSKTLLINGTY